MGIQIPRKTERDVLTGPLPTVREHRVMDERNFGGGPGVDRMFGTLNQGADLAQRIALEAHERAEEAQFNDLSAKLAGEELRLKTELSKVKGQAALEASGKTLSDFDRIGSEIGRGATTERVRQRLSQHASGRRVALQAFADPYAASEMQEFEATALKSRSQKAKELAWAGYADPLTVAFNLEDQANAITRYAALTGKPKEWVDGEILGEGSNLISGVISQFLDAGDYARAKEYHDRSVKDGTLSKRDAASLQRHMELGEAKSEAARIYSYTGSEEAAIDEAGKIKNQDVRDDVKRRIRNRYDEEREGLKEAYKSSLTEAMGRAGNKKLQGESAADVVGLRLYGSLKPKDQREVDTYFRQTRGLEAAETDWSAYYALRDMASRDETRGEFLNTNLMGYAGRLRPQELEQMMNLQTGLREKRANAIEEADGYRSTSDIVNSAVTKLKQAGHIGRRDEAEEEVFKRIVDDGVKVLQKASTNGKAKNEDVRTLVDNLSMEIVLEPGTFWDTKGPAYKKIGQIREASKTVIPEQERKLVEDALRRKGQPVTDSNVIDFYKFKLEEEAKNAGR